MTNQYQHFGACPSVVVVWVNKKKQKKRESRTAAPKRIGSSIWLSTALTSCLAARALPRWPPVTSSGPIWQPEMCSAGGEVCGSVCLPLCLAAFTSQNRRAADPGWRTYRQTRGVPSVRRPPRISCQSAAVWSPRAGATHGFPSVRKTVSGLLPWLHV